MRPQLRQREVKHHLQEELKVFLPSFDLPRKTVTPLLLSQNTPEVFHIIFNALKTLLPPHKLVQRGTTMRALKLLKNPKLNRTSQTVSVLTAARSQCV